MNFCKQDIMHAQWMLKKQINSADDLIGFWISFGPHRSGPVVERCKPVWYHDLPSVTTYVRKNSRRSLE